MRPTKILAPACWVMLALASQNGSPETPAVQDVLDRYVRALGGAPAIQKLTSRVSKGTIEVPDMGATGVYEQYAKAPNQWLSVSEFTGWGAVRRGFDGKSGWSDEPERGLRDLSPQEIVRVRRSAEFHRDLKLMELFPDLRLKGKEPVNGRDAFVLESHPAGELSRRLYFDAETGLMTRSDIEIETPNGRATTVTLFEDYREVDGVKLPFTVSQTSPTLRFIIRLKEAAHNVAIDEAKFARPKATAP